MINESTLGENDNNKSSEQFLSESSATHLDELNQSSVSLNGDISPGKSTAHLPKQTVILNDRSMNDDFLERSSEPTDEKRLITTKESTDVVDLSSDIEDDYSNKKMEEAFEVRSNASSDVCIIDDDKEGGNVVFNKVSVKKEYFLNDKGPDLLDDNRKSAEEDGNCINSVNKEDNVPGPNHLKDKEDMPDIQLESHETSVIEGTDNDNTDNVAGDELVEKSTSSNLEDVTDPQLNEQQNNSEESAVSNNDPDQPELDLDKHESEQEVLDNTATAASTDEVDNRKEADQSSKDTDENSPTGDEVVMEVDEVEQDEEMEELVTNTSADKVSGGDKVVSEAKEVEEHSSAAPVNNVQEVDNIETITGDHSLSEEAVLKNPDVTVCILSNSSPEKRTTSADLTDDKKKEESNRPSTSTDNSSLVEKDQSGTVNSEKNDVSEAIRSGSEDTPCTSTSSHSMNEETPKKMKTLKVLYPKKKQPSGELEMVSVSPAIRDCLQCAKYTTCSTKVAISGIDCYLCSKECITEQKLLHKKAVAVGSVVLPSSVEGINDVAASTNDINTVNNINVVSSVQQQQQHDGENASAILARPCTTCSKEIRLEQLSEGDLEGGVLQWATMDFCSEECLAKFQALTGSNCQLCGADVTAMSMGKYSVRFGYETRQFCSATCLEEFKKGLKACSYCQRDLNSDGNDESIGFLAPVGEKGQFKDFCSQDCLEKYDSMSHNIPVQLTAHECAVCNKIKIVRLEVLTAEKIVKLCSEVCFNAFKFVNDKMKISLCNMCKKYFDVSAFNEQVMFYEDQAMKFCSKTCMNVQVLSKRKICPCSWCKVKKYNFDMIRKKMNNTVVYMCSLNCLALYQVSLRASIGKQKLKCDWCGKTEKANFHLTMSDASLRNFCSFECVDKFRGQYKMGGTSGPVTTTSSLIVGSGGVVSSTNSSTSSLTVSQTNCSTANTSGGLDLPIISSVHSLKKFDTPVTRSHLKVLSKTGDFSTSQQTTAPPQPPSVTAPQTQTITEVLVRPRSPVLMKNKVTNVRVRRATKGTSCRPNKVTRSVQTDTKDDEESEESSGNKAIIPVPVPIYVPAPLAMYSIPVPTLVPVPIPIPIPVFVPTSSSLAKDILEDIKRIQDTLPRDPFEAELLTMAEAAAEKPDETSTQTNGIEEGLHRLSGEEEDVDEEGNENRPIRFMQFEPLSVMEDSSSCGAEDKTSQQQSPTADVRDPLGSPIAGDDSLDVEMEHSHHNHITDEGDDSTNSSDIRRDGIPSRKRMTDSSPRLGLGPAKRKKTSEEDDVNISNKLTTFCNKPDDHMVLKYTLGVNAWKYFANNYNEDAKKKKVDGLGTEINGQSQLLRTDLLEMRHDELNQALSLLMKEGKLPNGESYSPDTKYYLALGIQFYLLHNGRVDNIFSDAAYEGFTDQLDKQADLFQESTSGKNIVTRVQEEHLWESRQLGVHSPHVLLSTLMYLNTKYFNLTTVEEHMQLSFSHIMKQSKRGTSSSPAAASMTVNDEENRVTEGEADDSASSCSRSSSRSVLLRFYPPQLVLENNPKKKKMYEQYENEDDPSRCPVRLYEFYLSRCPESVKSRSDVFYLQPERSCAPDSPVWYTSTPLPDSLLQKMLNRIKMVKEINMAFVSQ